MKNKKINLLALTSLAAAPIASMASLASCGQTNTTEYHILNINDIHGAIPGFGEDVTVVDKNNPGCFRLFRDVNKIMQQYPGSVFLSAGDENSSDSWSTCSHAQTTYPVLKAMGVRYCAVGNHAFEWGYDDMNKGAYDRIGRTDQTQGNYFVTSNIFNTSGYNGKTDWVIDEKTSGFIDDFNTWNSLRVKWADPYKILNFGNAKVALIGLTTTGTIEDGNKSVTQNLSFVDYKASVHYTKYLMKQELQDAYNSIDSFILFTHCASDVSKDGTITGEAADLAASIDTDIDAVISAHSHKLCCGQIQNNTLNKKIWIAQAQTAGRHFADTKLIFDHNALPGKKLKSISMSVHKVDIGTDEKAAKAEWNNYRTNPTSEFKELANAYNYERKWVDSFFSKKLSTISLTEDDMQNSTTFKGYYNGIKDATCIPDPTKKVTPGHDYYDCPDILDHFGGWTTRSFQLGYYYAHQEEIQSSLGIMPSCSFVTQDTIPGNLSNGDVCVREVYNMVPYDNPQVIHYLSILQIANIVNYALAGKPNKEETQGFKYHSKHVYKPDLNIYCGDSNTIETPLAVGLSEKDSLGTPTITSNYICGPLAWNGMQITLTKITDDERTKTVKNPQLDQEFPLYDESATYRVDTYKAAEFTINGAKYNIALPKIKIFEYKYDSTTQTDNLKDFDNLNSESWVDAQDWFSRELKSGELVPVMTNSFMFNGGNNQTKMFKEYTKFNSKKYGLWFTPYTTSETSRDLIQYFLTSAALGKEWIDGKQAPVDIAWTKVQNLVQGLSK